MVRQFSASDYSKDQLLACESVILELHRILGNYWKDIVLVGGWVPTLLANDEESPHIGTTDIDLALNHLVIPEEAYKKIHELLLDAGYEHNTDPAKQFQYFRRVEIEGIIRTVILDLLTGQYDVETGKGRRHEPIQDVMALKAEGVDLVFTRYETRTISGSLPDKGGLSTAEIKIASVAPVIVMKCAAIAGRYKDKDSYDLFYFVKHYNGGGQAVLDALKPDIKHGSIIKAIKKIREHFASVDHEGPSQVVRFLELSDDAEVVTRRDVFETMSAFLTGVDALLAQIS